MGIKYNAHTESDRRHLVDQRHMSLSSFSCHHHTDISVIKKKDPQQHNVDQNLHEIHKSGKTVHIMTSWCWECVKSTGQTRGACPWFSSFGPPGVFSGSTHNTRQHWPQLTADEPSNQHRTRRARWWRNTGRGSFWYLCRIILHGHVSLWCCVSFIQRTTTSTCTGTTEANYQTH